VRAIGTASIDHHAKQRENLVHKNRLRELLDAGLPSMGTHVLSTWPTITEIVGQTGLWDYVEFVAEYAPWTMYDLDNLGRAIELSPDFTGMIKIEQSTRGHLAMRAIGSGIQNLIFADIRTAEDALECVRAVRAERPDQGGLHGVGMRRDAGTVLYGGSPQWVQSLADCVVVLMIEKKQALENLDAILSVKGVDMVQFGPADYALSIGAPLSTAQDAVQEAETYMMEVASKKGVAVRAELHDVTEAHGYLDLGVRHYCLGHDVRILHDWYVDQGRLMRELFLHKTWDSLTFPDALTHA
jgi:2-keto-3-deoxy-L-rhamnonate aldolase RhmA